MFKTPDEFVRNPQVQRVLLIGIICQRWAILEYTFSQVIWQMLDLEPETGKIVTGGLDMGPRYNMAINLARHLKQPKPLVDALVRARREIQDNLDVRRNRAVHGVPIMYDDWSMDVEVHRGKGGRERQPLAVEELESLSAEISSLQDELRHALGPFVNSIAKDLEIAAETAAWLTSMSERPSDESPK